MTDSYSRSRAGVTRALARRRKRRRFTLTRARRFPSRHPLVDADDRAVRRVVRLHRLSSRLGSRRSRRRRAQSLDARVERVARFRGGRRFRAPPAFARAIVANVVASGEGSGRRVGRVGWVGRGSGRVQGNPERSGKSRRRSRRRNRRAAGSVTAARKRRARPRIRVFALSRRAFCVSTSWRTVPRDEARPRTSSRRPASPPPRTTRVCADPRVTTPRTPRGGAIFCATRRRRRDFFARLARLGRDAATPRHTPSSSRFESVTSPWRSPPFSRDDAPPRDERLESRVRERAMATKNRSSRLLASPSRFAEKHSPRVESPSPRSAMKRVVRAFELHALDRPDARSFQPRVEDSIASESRDGERRGVDLSRLPTRLARAFSVANRHAVAARCTTTAAACASARSNARLRRFEAPPRRSTRESSFGGFLRVVSPSFRVAAVGSSARGAFQKRCGPPRKRGFQTRASSVFAREVSPLASVPLDVRDVAPPSEREPS